MRAPCLVWVLSFVAPIVACDPCAAPCKAEGRCESADGECVARSEGDCKASAGCTTDGRCGFDAATKTCVAATTGSGPAGTDACASSGSCAEAGRCTSIVVSAGKVEEFGSRGFEATKGVVSCGATKPEHCKASTLCQRFGQCSLQGNACVVASDADCAGSAECSDRGRCKKSQRDAVCTPEGDAACASAKECASHGHCTAQRGSTGEVEACGPKDAAACKASPACKSEGLCSAVPTGRGYALCMPASDADCAASEACKADGRCKKWDRSCGK
jgi:hypothetical protein